MNIDELFNDYTAFASKKNAVACAIANGDYENVTEVKDYIRRLNSDLNYVFTMFLQLPTKGEEGYDFRINEIAKFMNHIHTLHDEHLEELTEMYVNTEQEHKMSM